MASQPDEVAPPAEPTAEQRLKAYNTALRRHYWAHFYAPSEARQRGEESLKWILSEAKVIDPDFTVFNQHAPVNFRRRAGA